LVLSHIEPRYKRKVRLDRDVGFAPGYFWFARQNEAAGTADAAA